MIYLYLYPIILHISQYVIQCLACIDNYMLDAGSVPLQVVVADALPDGPLGECVLHVCTDAWSAVCGSGFSFCI